MTFVPGLRARMRSKRAALRLGDRWAESGKLNAARTAFQLVLKSGDRYLARNAALHLWTVYARGRNPRRSLEMYQEALRIQAAHQEEPLGRAAISIGSALGADHSFGFLPPPRVTETIYPLTIRSADQAVSAAAALGFGMMQWELANRLHDDNRFDHVAEYFQMAFDTRHPEYAPTAAHWLAFFYEGTGQAERSRPSLQWLVDSGDPEYAQGAARSLERLDRD